MKEKREISVEDVRKLVGTLLTIVEATVPEGNQKATKDLVTQTVWKVLDVVGVDVHLPSSPNSTNTMQ